MSQFIEVIPDVLSADYCQQLIEKFERSGQATAGQTGQGVDTSKKHSSDIMLNQFPNWASELAALGQHTLQGLIRYIRQHPFLLVGPISPTVLHPKTRQPVQLSHENIHEFDDATLANIIRAVYRLGNINLQKYNKGEGGYHHWHSEVYPHPSDPAQDSLHRVLVFMYYLNDVSEGGETNFFYQNQNLKPKRGSLVLFPTGFTHTHKGSVPISDDKYILTSWVLYQPAAKLYGQQ